MVTLIYVPVVAHPTLFAATILWTDDGALLDEVANAEQYDVPASDSSNSTTRELVAVWARNL